MERVNVHLNLRSPGRKQFTVRDRTLKKKTDDTYVLLKDVRFVVNPKGSQRVKEQGRRNTHAYVRGRLIEHDSTTTPTIDGMVQCTYNPFEHTSFIRTDTGEPVSYTAVLVCYKGKVYADKGTLI